MNDAEKRKKVIQGLEACNRKINNGSDCENCPYYDDEDTAELPFGICNIQDMFDDALALLKEQEPRVIELSEIIPTVYVWVEDRNEKTLFPLKGGMIDPDGDEYFRFFENIDTDYVYWPTAAYKKLWRVWNLMPSPEQIRDTKWKENSDVE